MIRERRKTFGLLVALLVTISTPCDAVTATTDLDRAWRAYWTNDRALAPSYQFPHAYCFSRAANTYGLPKTLLLALARGESDFEETAVSHANAHGVMQILWPTTAKHLGIHRLSQLYDPCTNIDAGTRYLKELLTRYAGNLHLALAAYNYGPNRIPVTGGKIPSGAAWYSGYIYRHLNYVLGDRSAGAPAPSGLYSDVGRSTLLSFAEPYRAEAFIARMDESAPGIELDWFRRDVGEFVVVLSYRTHDEFNSSVNQLRNAGFALN